MKHFIILVPMGGRYKGRIAQHSTMQPTRIQAAKWAKQRFAPGLHIVIVPMGSEASILSVEDGERIYSQATNKGETEIL